MKTLKKLVEFTVIFVMGCLGLLFFIYFIASLI